MLYLNQQTIESSITMEEMINAMEEAYLIYADKNYQMPTRMQVQQDTNTMILMPCITDQAIATKLLTSFPENKDKPVIQGLVILNDSQNGEVLAIMDGNFITGFRTGALGGAAVRRLAKPDAERLAVIGAGVQGFYQTLAACAARDFKEIYITNRTYEKLEPLIERLYERLPDDIAIYPCHSAEEAIQHADVVITATSSHDPVLPDDQELLKGKLIVGIGSFQPSMREFPQQLYALCDHFFVDSEDAMKECGDVIQAVESNWFVKEDIHEFSDVVQINSFDAGEYWRNNPEGSVVFKSTGMGLFDVVAANVIHDKVMLSEVGTKLE